MKLVNCYSQIISDQNIWLAWKQFRIGKGHRADVCLFERRLESNLLSVRDVLRDRTHTHGSYRAFIVHDPKRRLIHVPTVRDQVVHQAVWNVLFPFFNRRFSPSTTSCRPGMGTSAARSVIRKWGKNRATQFVLHMDVVKCFDSISHEKLEIRVSQWIDCKETLLLVSKILSSYSSGFLDTRHGIPLGNLTSQLFCNVAFMDFDREMDLHFGIGSWVRYADDVFVVDVNKDRLRRASVFISSLLSNEGLKCRIGIHLYHGFEALGSRWFHGGFESIMRATRNRAIRLLQKRFRAHRAGERSQQSVRSSFDSLIGLAVHDRRWTKQLQQVILETI